MTDEHWRRIREEFPITASRAYLFAGGLAPLSRAGRAAIEGYAEVWSADPVTAYRERATNDAETLRAEVAALIGAAAGDVAIVDSTSRANNLAVAMVEAPPGANVVVDSTTYPTAYYPWVARTGVEIRLADRTDVVHHVDGRTVAVSVSHVCRWTGFRHDLAVLAEAAHAVGAVLLVDAAQSAGVAPIDVDGQGIDFLSFGAMKWLLGAPGVAFFYVRPAIQARTPPPHAPAAAHVDDGTLTFPAGGRRHEPSSLAWPLLAACRAGLSVLDTAPPAAVEQRVLDLSGQVIDGLQARGFGIRTPLVRSRRAGVVVFECANADRVAAALRRRGVDVWGWRDRGVVRVDPHVYNDGGDIERFLAALDGLNLSDN